MKFDQMYHHVRMRNVHKIVICLRLKYARVKSIRVDKYILLKEFKTLLFINH